jgi:hypothetical protein
MVGSLLSRRRRESNTSEGGGTHATRTQLQKPRIFSSGEHALTALAALAAFARSATQLRISRATGG